MKEEKKRRQGKGGMMSQRGESGLTIILGSTEKDGGQMLSPVFSGWMAPSFDPKHREEPH